MWCDLSNLVLRVLYVNGHITMLLRQTLQKLNHFGLNIEQPKPLAHDNKGIIILSFPVSSVCVWRGLPWTFSMSSSIVGG